MDDYAARVFVRDSLAANISRDDIRRNLLSSGWSPDVIDKIFFEIDAEIPYAAITPVRRSGIGLRVFLIGIVVLLSITTVAFFMLQKGSGSGVIAPADGRQDRAYPPLSVEDVRSLMLGILSSNISFTDVSRFSYQSCTQNASYEGIIVGTNTYARLQTTSAGTPGESACRSMSVMDSYLENYWIDRELYGRQYPNKNFAKYHGSGLVKAPTPQDYIYQLFGNINALAFQPPVSAGPVFTSDAQIRNSSQSGQLRVSVDSQAHRITRVEYSVQFFSGVASASGIITFMDPPAAVSLPDLAPSDTDFLSFSLGDINDFSGAEYEVSSAQYLLTTDVSVSKIHTLVGEGSSAAGADCYLSSPACQSAMTRLKAHYSSAVALVGGARVIACEREPTMTGFASQVYKDRFQLRALNHDRNPRDSFDYSYTINFYLAGDRADTYLIRLRLDKEYCYTGTSDPVAVGSLIREITALSKSLFN